MDTKVKARDVIGPMPADHSALMVLWANERTFVVPCTLADAEACHDFLAEGKRWRNPYDFLADLLKVRDAAVTHARLFRSGESLYSSVFLKEKAGGKPLRISSDNPGLSVNSSLYSGAPLVISASDLSDTVDSSTAYESLRKVMPNLWPLSPLTDTGRLGAFSDFLGEAMPNGSIFEHHENTKR